MPYRGLQYERGELSTQLDDMGTVAYGEKEIYYMDTVVTKTHFAVFRTSSRLDGLGAKDNVTAAGSRSASDTTSLRKLDRIDIYAKNPGGSPSLIKSVCFSYDYTTSTGLPNTSGGTGGRLTLKKIWFEYNGIYNARINPYVFTYAYPTSTQEANYPTKYRTLKDTIFASGDQNPSYSPFDIDPWGNYQKNGNNRYDSMRTWVNQNPSPTFDPAAWQLKDIKLPTGGEIRIQYEQDDYAFVQDQPVHAMMSLKNASNDVTSASNQYFLNMKDIGMNEDSVSWKAVRQRIQDLYVTPKKKMYFKFLYHLDDPLGSTSTTPSINSCNAEYIKGYCSVLQVGYNSTNGVYVRLGSSTLGAYDLPKKVCRNYVKTQRLGSLDLSGNCNPSIDGIGSNSDPEKIVENLAGFLTTIISPGDLQLCKTVNFPLSYLKIPIPKAKKGGGLRVKRILMYDNGIESGDVSLFGSQYSYIMPDGTSSGVATNEPGGMREENALVQFDQKFKQSFLNKIVAGRDKEQVELPLGEGIYPSPSVGYARVVIQNIHNGITNAGFIVKEFNTAKDYPVKVDYTSIDTQRDFLPVPGGCINIFINNIWMTQGFVFKLNSMHGQPKSETTYRGSATDFTNASIGSQQVFSYFQPGEKVPMMGAVNSITWANPGKEMETVFESRGMEDISHNLELQFDIDVGLAGIIPIPFASIVPSYTYTEGKMYSHTTTKIINYPAIQKSVVSYADGIYHITDNVAFNPNTGKPVLTRTTDGYHQLALQQDANHSGRYYHYDFPATGSYPAMGQKAKNERFALLSTANVSIQKKSTSGKYYLEFTPGSGQSVCNAMSSLYAGDLVKITEPSGAHLDLGLYHVSDSISGNNLFLLQTAAYGSNSNLSNTSNHNVVIEVIKSGLRNQLNTSIGSFTTYGDTARIMNSNPGLASSRQIFVDTLNALLQRSAACGCSKYTPASHFPAGVNITNSARGCGSPNYNGHDTLWFQVTGSYLGVGLYGFCDNSYPYQAGMTFGLDQVTQQLVYFLPSNQCHGKPFGCFSFCDNSINITKVVQAEAKTMKDNWPYDNAVYAQVSGSDPYENGMRGKWRQRSNYVYKDTIIGANAATQRNYKSAGVFTLNLFNWLDSTNIPSQWLKLNTVTQYSPDGNALEEQDILGIFSAAKFGYNGTQPYLVAKNADYQAVQFEGFENLYGGTKFEDGWTPVNAFTRDVTVSHSGIASLKLAPAAIIDLKPLKITQQMLNNGLDMKVWVRDTSIAPATAVKGTITGSPTVNVTFTQVARTGEWSLYEGKASAANLAVYSVGAVVTPKIQNNYSSTKAIWIDDLRIQPLDAQVMAYVYDLATLRLIASFDDQNFGLFYQYNAEGKLVRKMVETQNGLKTVTETQYHTPGTARNH